MKEGGHLTPSDRIIWTVEDATIVTTLGDVLVEEGFDRALVGIPVVVDEGSTWGQLLGGRDVAEEHEGDESHADDACETSEHCSEFPTERDRGQVSPGRRPGKDRAVAQLDVGREALLQPLARMVRVVVWIRLPFQRQRPTRLWVPGENEISRFQ